MESRADEAAAVAAWRAQLADIGVWANDPVPLFPYPGSPDYTRLWGPPDCDAATCRARLNPGQHRNRRYNRPNRPGHGGFDCKPGRLSPGYPVFER